MTLLISKFKSTVFPTYTCVKKEIILTNLGVPILHLKLFVMKYIYLPWVLEIWTENHLLSDSACNIVLIYITCLKFSTSFYRKWQIKAGSDLVLVTLHERFVYKEYSAKRIELVTQ